MSRYLVNSGGVVHNVPDEQFNIHLSVARQTALQRASNPFMPELNAQPIVMPREATPEEIAAYWDRQGFVYDPESGDALTKAEAAERAAKSAAATAKTAAK